MRVVLAEDNALLRAGLSQLLAGAGIDVVGEAGDAERLLDVVRTTRPDVAVLDVRMPPTHTTEGLQAAHRIRAEHGRSVAILVLSHHVETRYAVDLLADGAAGVGYLLKDRVLGPDELTEAILRVGSGGSAIDPVVVQHLMRRRAADTPLATLTARESEVLGQVAQGRSNRSVASQLHISEKTVEACIGRIFTKLDLEDSPNAHRRVQAVLAYLRGAQR